MDKYLPIVILLTGCQLYGGVSIHDRSLDSEYKEDNVITTFGASEEVNKNLEVFIEHDSMPFYRETKGYGVNSVGLKLKYEVGK